MQLGPRRFFFAGQRVVHASELIRSDVHFQNLAPRAEAPPAATDWSEPWHNILHVGRKGFNLRYVVGGSILGTVETLQSQICKSVGTLVETSFQLGFQKSKPMNFPVSIAMLSGCT